MLMRDAAICLKGGDERVCVCVCVFLEGRGRGWKVVGKVVCVDGGGGVWGWPWKVRGYMKN